MALLNFSISELCASNIAKRDHINNTPPLYACDNLLHLIYYVLQPLRDKLGKPIYINSGYRCVALNSHKEIKGAQNSQHLIGQAADIRVDGMTPAELVKFIKDSGIVYDQLINEYDKWVHVSYRHRLNRKKYFKIT